MDREFRENHVKNQKLALSISDASWAKFVNMLEYKALWHDRVVPGVGGQRTLSAEPRQQKVGIFFPSSQTCNHCGFINPKVKDLKLREWDCRGCNGYNLRDENAARNILEEGLRILEASDAPAAAQNAYRDEVSPELTSGTCQRSRNHASSLV